MKTNTRTASWIRFRFFLSTLLLEAGIVYLIVPIDIIPDLLGPLGWVDDIAVLGLAFLTSARAYRKMKKAVKK